MGTLRVHIGLVLLTVITMTVAAMAAPPSATGPATKVSQPSLGELIAELNADDFKARKTAQEKLSAMGDDALAAVQAARQTATDPETRGRLDAILRAIERNSINQPTLVSLHLHNANPREAFDALARQSGYTLPIWPDYMWQQNGPPFKPVSVDVSDATYWTAMRAVCAQTDVHLQSMGGFSGQPTLMQGDNAWATSPEVQSGAFLVVATDVTRHHVANLSKAHDIHRDLHVSVTIFPELKLHVVQADQQLAVQRIEDETGASLLPSGQREIPPAAKWDQPSPFAHYPYNYSVQLDSWRSPIGQRIATFKGSARFRVQASGGQIVFADAPKAKNVTQTVSGRRAVLNSCTEQNHNFQAQITLYRDSLTQDEWRAFERGVNDARMVDGDGNVYRMNGGGGGGSDQESHWSLFMSNQNGRGGTVATEPKTGEAPKLTIPFALEVREVTVPFEFHDLPIP